MQLAPYLSCEMHFVQPLWSVGPTRTEFAIEDHSCLPEDGFGCVMLNMAPHVMLLARACPIAQRPPSARRTSLGTEKCEKRSPASTNRCCGRPGSGRSSGPNPMPKPRARVWLCGIHFIIVWSVGSGACAWGWSGSNPNELISHEHGVLCCGEKATSWKDNIHKKVNG